MNEIFQWTNLIIKPVSHPPPQAIEQLLKRFPLDRGELDCLHLAYNLRPCTFFTDDLAARTVAQKLHIEVHGTVGLISYCAKRRWLSLDRAEQAINALYEESNLFITYEIIEQAISQLREST